MRRQGLGRALAEPAVSSGLSLRARVRDDCAPGRAFLLSAGFVESGAQLSLHWSSGRAASYQPPMPALRVRPASARDQGAIEKLSQASWSSGTGAPDTRADEIAQLFGSDDRVVLLAESSGKPLGYLAGV